MNRPTKRISGAEQELSLVEVQAEIERIEKNSKGRLLTLPECQRLALLTERRLFVLNGYDFS